MKWFSELTPIEISLLTVLIAGILSFITSLSVSLFSNYRQKKTTFINTITSNRIKWIHDLQSYITDFIMMTGLNESFEIYSKDEEDKEKEFLDSLKHVKTSIFLHLNYKGDLDKSIIKVVNEIYNCVDCIYELKQINNIETKAAKIGFVGLRLELGDIKFFESLEGFEAYSKKDGQQMVEIFEEFRKKYRTKMLEVIGKLIGEIEEKHNELIKLVQIYCKLEWDRVKRESKGRNSLSDKKMIKTINIMKEEYDLSLYKYKVKNLCDYM